MIFSKKKITVAYTIEQCVKCKLLTRRKFKEGDVLFSNTSQCNSCGGAIQIEKIFGESSEL
ncbi:hypothetical protein K0U27_05230 [archaeon]|nr:hypothetical protein [archaeon]